MPLSVDLEADLLAEGEPEVEFNPGIASRIPRKRAAGGVLIRDEDNRILFVEPVYKPTLDIPGGIADENESPLDTCIREVREELGCDLPVGSLLVADWVPAHGVWPDGLMFIFDGGILAPDAAANLAPTDPEIRALRFLHLDQAAGQMRPSMVRRLQAALEATESGAVFAQFGHSLRS